MKKVMNRDKWKKEKEKKMQQSKIKGEKDKR